MDTFINVHECMCIYTYICTYIHVYIYTYMVDSRKNGPFFANFLFYYFS